MAATSPGSARPGQPVRAVWWKRLAREPLCHFLLIGLLLFVAFDLFGGNRNSEDNRIVIDDAVVADLVGRYAGIWQRPPNRAELDRLIADHVKDEILYRQGAAMGLVDSDPIVRRRIRQKLEVLSEEAGDSRSATDAELAAYLQRHRDTYRQPPRLSFEQVFFDPVKHGAGLAGVIAGSLAKLRGGADAASLGDVSLLPDRMEDAAPDRIAADFGGEFARTLATQPVDRWVGPIKSGLGEHLVRVTGRKQGEAPQLGELRGMVQRDWEEDRRRRNASAYYAALRKDYDVSITADLGKPEVPAR